MTPAVRAVLARARARIADPARWTTGAAARDRNGLACYHGPGGPAVAWCAVGAVWAEVLAARLHCTPAMHAELATVANSWTEVVNDQRGHAAALARFDEALARAGVAGLLPGPTGGES